MQTNLASFIKNTEQGREANAILRSCVHCGFCTATCPTYQLLGDELDGPRGRIYLIKQVLEGQRVTHKTQLHLDRCLTCRACETTCPSGVRYAQLLEIGRNLVEQQVPRSLTSRTKRWLLRTVLPYQNRFTPLLKTTQLLRPLLTKSMQRQLIPKHANNDLPHRTHSRKVLLLDGCVQPGLAPNINQATVRVLDRFGIEVIPTPAAGCCGALPHHLNAPEQTLTIMRKNIDAWWPAISSGVEALIGTASGCTLQLTEYGHLLRNDPDYADKANTISELSKDIAEVIADSQFTFEQFGVPPARTKIAFHAPCTLQHGLQLNGTVEKILHRFAVNQVTNIQDAHLCCGSAGTYSILEPKLSRLLKVQKVEALAADQPDRILTANIGCLMQLKSGTTIPVQHWIEFIDELINP